MKKKHPASRATQPAAMTLQAPAPLSPPSPLPPLPPLDGESGVNGLAVSESLPEFVQRTNPKNYQQVSLKPENYDLLIKLCRHMETVHHGKVLPGPLVTHLIKAECKKLGLV